MLANRFPTFQQLDEKDCGPACLKIILKFYERNISIERLIDLCETTRTGSTLHSISEAAEKVNFKTLGIKCNFETLKNDVPLPCIIFWQQKHFVVVYKINKDRVYVSDPAYGLITYTTREFNENWIGSNANLEGVALILEPTSAFYNAPDEQTEPTKLNFKFLSSYLHRYKSLNFQLALGLLGGSVIQLLFPFLTQAIVDLGIQNHDLNFILLVLLAQLLLFLGKISLEVVRSWILLHIGSRVKISLMSDFFIKLMKLPIAFFDVKVTDDLIQRISDNKKIQSFLTITTLNVLFSTVNLVILKLTDWRGN